MRNGGNTMDPLRRLRVPRGMVSRARLR